MGKAKVGILRDLGDGLVLRRATLEDAEQLCSFNGSIHGDDEDDARRVAAWTRDLCVSPPPNYSVGDFTIVEDTHTGKIVSSMDLISQTWSYAGVEFGVGRPELVGTHLEYRNRGLVRAQFELVHQWSAERGEIMQAITGIPFYYRLFGYEMTVNLDGGRAGYLIHIPRLKEGEQEPFAIRPAEIGDIPFMMELYELGAKRSVLACKRDEAVWRYELSGKSAENVNRYELYIVENLAGQPLAFFGTPPFAWRDRQAVTVYEVKPGVSWGEVTPCVIRYIEKVYAAHTAGQKDALPYASFGFWLGEEHPVYHVIPRRLPFQRRSYAWYLRLPDLPGFLRKIAPVLESRLEASYIPGYTGEVRMTFYNGGLRLGFDKGKLVLSEPYKPTPTGHEGDVAFPGLTFLQLLFGYRALHELEAAFPDCWVDRDEVYVLMETLFPRQPSNVWPIS